MALEVLAKYPILRDGDPQLLFGRGPLWVDGVGLISSWYTGANGSWYYGAVQLDGTMSYIDTKPSVFLSAGVSLRQDLLTGRVLVFYHYGYGWARLMDAKTGIFDADLIFNGSPSFYPVSSSEVRLADRWLYAVNTSIRSAPLTNEGPWTTEHVIPESVSGHPTISDAGNGSVWLVYPGGTMVLYDYISKETLKAKNVVWPFAAGSDAVIKGVWWSRELEVFIAVTYDSTDSNKHYIWVFADETKPHALSSPVALSTLQKGDVTTMEVTLTGEQGDPAEGFLVDWSIIAGTGALSVGQSTTDEDGKATTDYIAPSNSPTTFELQAEVTY